MHEITSRLSIDTRAGLSVPLRAIQYSIDGLYRTTAADRGTSERRLVSLGISS